jgi:hypothetical protein
LKAGAIAAFTAGAFYVVGNLTDVVNGSPWGSHTQPNFDSPAYAFNIAGHALVGCASAEVSGGKCGPAAQRARRPDRSSASLISPAAWWQPPQSAAAPRSRAAVSSRTARLRLRSGIFLMKQAEVLTTDMTKE